MQDHQTYLEEGFAMENTLPCIEPNELRQVLGSFVTGVTVITTVDSSGRPAGLTANSFSSVSLEPPLVLWSQALNAPSYPIFRDAERFAICILADDQIEISKRFSSRVADRFEGVKSHEGLGGVPLIDGAAAYIECVRECSYPGGDHAVFLGRVVRIERRERRPLVFGSGRYMIAAPSDLGAFSIDIGLSNLDQVRAVRYAGTCARALAEELVNTVGVGVWGNRGPTIVHWEESERPVSENLRPGVVLPVLGSVTGMALGAHLPEALTSDLIQQELLQPPDGRRCGSAEEVQRAFAEIRRSGVAVNIASDPATLALHGGQVNVIAAPAFGRDGAVLLTLNVLCHSAHADEGWKERVTSALKRVCNQISKEFGWSPEA
jgi:flavin reductase (DIM6/NTAB) family NADH-FMN oxidoreductase RutF/DNA-binding IclR family transcriptional regulator